MTTLWWVRHGPTHAKTMIGWTDMPADLSDKAKLRRLSQFLPDTPIVSSDLSRASATADAISCQRPRLVHESALREIHFGEWEDKSFTQAEQQNPALIRQYWDQPGDISPPGGESWNTLRCRVDDVADRLATISGDVIVVAHMGPILTQVQRATGKTGYETFGQKIDNLSVTKLSFDPIGKRWTAQLINHNP